MHGGRDVVCQKRWHLLTKFVNAAEKSENGFWMMVREITDVKPVTPAVSLDQLTTEFMAQVNVPDSLPADFDIDSLLCAALEADAIPPVTQDSTSEGYFSVRMSMEELVDIKEAMSVRGPSAMGFNRMTYQLFLALDNEHLLAFFNKCLELCGAPCLWLVTVLIGILKPGKEGDDPVSYCLISLESCLLKMFTLFIDRRMCQWMEDINILPETQNRFCKGYHGMNNPFIL